MSANRAELDASARYLAPSTPGQPDTWTALTGASGSQRLREVTELDPPPMVRDALALDPDERVVVRRRVMILGDRPVELTDSYYPSSMASGTPLAAPGKIRGGAPKALADLGHEPDEALEDVSVRAASPEEADLLDLKMGALVLVLFRIVRTEGGKPVEVSVMTMVPEGRHLRYRVRMA